MCLPYSFRAGNVHSHFATGPQGTPPLSIMRIFTREGAAVFLDFKGFFSDRPHPAHRLPPSPNIAMRVWYHFRSVSGIIVRFVLYFITYGVYDRYRSHGSSRSLYSHSSLISFIPGFVASPPSKNIRIIRAFDMSSITTSCSPEIYAFSPSCILYAERTTIGCAVWLSNLSTYTS